MPEIEYLGPLEDKSIRNQPSGGPKIEYVGPLNIDKSPPSDSPVENFLSGVWQGLKHFGQGMQQLTLRTDELLGMPHPESADEYTKRITEERQAFSQSPQGQSMATKTGSFVGEGAPYMALPVVKGGGLVTRILGNAAIGGTIGATQFIPEEGDRLTSTLIGAGVGAVPPVIGEGISRVAAKTQHTVAGQASKQSKKIMRAAEKHDVPVSYPDIARGPIAPKVGTYLEQVPGIGMGRFRQQQHDKALEATKRLMNEYAGGDDWAMVAKDSMLARVQGLQKVVGNYYDDLAKVADPKGNIPVNKTIATVDKLIQAESESKIPDKSLINMLTGIKDNLIGKKVPSGLVDTSGKPITRIIKINNFSNLRDFKSDLGHLVSDYYSGKNAIIGEKGVGVLQEIKNTVDDDIVDWAGKQSGDILAKWNRADQYYKTKIIPYREIQLLNKIANEGDPEAVYRLFKTGLKGRPESVFNALPKRGQDAIRHGMIRDAYEGALHLEGTQFSPAKFAGALERQKPAIKVFFQGPQRGELEGFINLMRHVERAGQYMENPPTGNRNLINFVMGGSAVGLAMTQPEALAGTAGMTYLMKTLFTTDTGKRFLLASSKLKPGSKVYINLVESYMSKLFAVKATTEVNK